MNHRSKLFRHKDPYDLAGTEALFLAAMKENARFQMENCPDYARICRLTGFEPQCLKTAEDLRQIPAIPTLYFKRHRLSSLPEGRFVLQATSSGTRGRRSEMGFDAPSLLAGFHMVMTMGKYRKLFSPVPVNYIILGYKPSSTNQMAVAKTAFGSTLFAPALCRHYALKETPKGFEVDFEGILAALEKSARSPFPTRFMAFPAYTLFLVQEMEKRGLRLQLPGGSRYFLGGGWKQFADRQVDKAALYGYIREYLGIPEENCVEFFGAVEHPILYCDCPHHHFHIPVYSRVLIRDVNTLEPVPMGEPGLVNLMTPMVGSMPILSILTDDLGILHEGASCGCGIKAPWLELLGRVGAADIKTCAAGAEEILKEGLE